jgi:NAD(P)-dependent dehydrogenase (short-subunit alcohol dehydrogenase family)
VPDEQRRMSWTEADVPDQSDRVAVVTGANTGIGYDTARVLAQHGAVVVLGCRNQAKAKDAATQIAGRAPGAQVEVLDLDLSDLSSVRAAAETVASTHDRIDLLVNNAGVRMTPYATTRDGFELQFATNHLGHFALPPRTLRPHGAAARSHHCGTEVTHRHRLEQPPSPGPDRLRRRPGSNQLPARARAYAQSKLANLLFTYELQRRLEAARSTTLAVAAHPGIVDTELHRNLRAARTVTAVVSLLGQKSARGALPTLRAATDPDVQGGEYYGPRGLFELRGAPTRRQSSDRSHDVAVASRLWDVSEQLTGVSYPLGGRS